MNHALKVLHVLCTSLLPCRYNMTRLYVCHKAIKRSIYLSIYLKKRRKADSSLLVGLPKEEDLLVPRGKACHHIVLWLLFY